LAHDDDDDDDDDNVDINKDWERIRKEIKKYQPQRI